MAVIALAGTLFLTGTFAVHAQESSDPVSPIAQEIAKKFNLNVSEVKAVFDSHRQNRMTTMQAQYEAALTKDVADGKITEAQKQLILAKHKEIMANRQNKKADFKTLPVDQRKSAMEKQRTDLQTWATQNGIDLKYLVGGFAMHGHMGKWVK